MINLSFDELRLIAQIINIRDYENKSKEDLIKALSEPKTNQKHQNHKHTKTKITNTKTKSKTRNKTKINIKTKTKTKSSTRTKNISKS